jgi:uncharacterized protein YcaQ
MNNKIPVISRENLQKIGIVGCHLHKWQGSNIEGLKKCFAKQGLIQLDTLNPAGRNHDIFFFSRIKEYRQGNFEEVLYTERLVFETYFHLLNAIAENYFPLFYCRMDTKFLDNHYTRILTQTKELYPSLLDEVLSYIKKNGPTSSSDLSHLGTVDRKIRRWKSSTKANNALDLLWMLGKIVVCKRDENYRKIYDLTENYFDQDQLVKIEYDEYELQYKRLLLKICSFPIINPKIAINKAGKTRITSKKSWLKRINKAIDELLKHTKGNDTIEPTLVYCKELNKIYLVANNWENLLDKDLDTEVRAIAPLDPLIWDRNILKDIFNFDYTWEVYKPVKDRKWGYYVYPLLHNGIFIGRVEVQFDKKKQKLSVFNYQKEKGINNDNDQEIVEGLNKLFGRWKKMIGAEEIIYDSTVPIKIY